MQLHRKWMMLCCLSLVACGQQENMPTQKVVPVVLVNDEIAVNEVQLNAVLAKAGSLSAAEKQQLSQDVTRRLLDQYLFMQRAIDDQLEHDPRVAQDLLDARRQILARAYFDRLAKQIIQPSDAEIRDYYLKNPLLFAQRRVYLFDEIAVADLKQVDQLRRLLQESKNLQDFASKVERLGIPYQVERGAREAETIAPNLLSKVAKLQRGQMMEMPNSRYFAVVQLTDYQEQALNETQVREVIVRTLLEQRRKALYDSEIQKIRAKAVIQFAEPYAALANAASAVPVVDVSRDTGLQSYQEQSN